MKVRNVTIGDQFKIGKHNTFEVVDFYEVKSLTTGEVIRPQHGQQRQEGIKHR